MIIYSKNINGAIEDLIVFVAENSLTEKFLYNKMKKNLTLGQCLIWGHCSREKRYEIEEISNNNHERCNFPSVDIRFC